VAVDASALAWRAAAGKYARHVPACPGGCEHGGL